MPAPYTGLVRSDASSKDSHRSYEAKNTDLQILFHFSGTVLPHVVCRPWFHLYLALYMFVNAFHRFGYIHDNGEHVWATIRWENLQIVYGLTMFLLVSYTNQCYSRYNQLMHLARNIIWSQANIGSEIHLVMAPKSKMHAKLCIRFCSAYIEVLFHALDGRKQSEEDWLDVTRKGLLYRDEWNFLVKFNWKQRMNLLLAWSLEVCKIGYLKAHQGKYLKHTIKRILVMRQMAQELHDEAMIGLPCAYRFVLNQALMTSLALLGLKMALSSSVLQGFAYMLILAINLGLFELVEQLVDPFGPDDVDLPVQRWVNSYRAQSEYFGYVGMSGLPADEETLMDVELEDDSNCCMM